MKRRISISSDNNFLINKAEVNKLFFVLENNLKFHFSRIEVSFVNDDTILKINSEYLNHDWFTDIITFDYSQGSLIDCELIISYDTAISNAKKYNVGINDELIRLLIHGILHVTGYDDKLTSEKIKMKKKENTLVQIYSDKYWILGNDSKSC